jgi:hypothetical protein
MLNCDGILLDINRTPRSQGDGRAPWLTRNTAVSGIEVVLFSLQFVTVWIPILA